MASVCCELHFRPFAIEGGNEGLGLGLGVKALLGAGSKAIADVTRIGDKAAI
jgi:hypothetical protein